MAIIDLLSVNITRFSTWPSINLKPKLVRSVFGAVNYAETGRKVENLWSAVVDIWCHLLVHWLEMTQDSNSKVKQAVLLQFLVLSGFYFPDLYHSHSRWIALAQGYDAV